MDAESARFDDPRDLLDPARVLNLERAASDLAAVMDSEDNGFEERPVFRVEWAVDENAIRVLGRRHFLPFASGRRCFLRRTPRC